MEKMIDELNNKMKVNIKLARCDFYIGIKWDYIIEWEIELKIYRNNQENR